MAERVARVTVELAAYEQAASVLARDPDVHFVAGGAAGGSVILEGMARMIFSTTMTRVGAEGFPPYLEAIIQVRLVGPANIRASLRSVLREQDKAELYGQILARQRLLVARYDALAPYLLQLPSLDGGGQEEFTHLQSIVNELSGLEQFASLLNEYDRRWEEPESIRQRLLAVQVLAPDNPLVLNSVAELMLQMDKPIKALDYASRALAIAPDFARAHDTRGAILLRQRLPRLAVEAFSKAVALAPGNSDYRVHRASAYLVLEEEPSMCDDFASACVQGDCEGLTWARKIGRCRDTAAP